MISKQYFFSINSFYQATEVITNCKKYNIIPILHIKYFIVIKFGINWIIELKSLLIKNFNNDFKLLVDVKKNYGLFISLVENKIEYLNVEADKKTLIRLKQIARTNKVLINPNCSIVELNKIKNITLKIKKTINI